MLGSRRVNQARRGSHLHLAINGVKCMQHLGMGDIIRDVRRADAFMAYRITGAATP